MPMPGKVKRNPIYKRLYVMTHHKNQNANLLFIGGVGSGKTYDALRWGYDLDPDFSIERVCFSLKEFLRLLKEGDSRGKLKKGSVVVLDEIAGSEEGADSRSFMSKTNKTYSFLATTFRVRGLIVILCAPMRSQIDANLRRVGVRGICQHEEKNIDYAKKRNKVRFTWMWVNALSGDDYMPMPVLHEDDLGFFRVAQVSVPMPPKELVEQYEKKKDAFLSGNITRWLHDIETEEKKSASKEYFQQIYEKVALPKVLAKILYFEKNRWRVKKTLLKFEVDAPDAVLTALKDKVERDIQLKELKVPSSIARLEAGAP